MSQARSHDSILVVEFSKTEGLSIVPEGIKKWKSSVGFDDDTRPIVFVSLVCHDPKLEYYLTNELLTYFKKNTKESKETLNNKTAKEQFKEPKYLPAVIISDCKIDKQEGAQSQICDSEAIECFESCINKIDEIINHKQSIKDKLSSVKLQLKELVAIFTKNTGTAPEGTTSNAVTFRTVHDNGTPLHKEKVDKQTYIEGNNIPPPSDCSQQPAYESTQKARDTGIYLHPILYENVIEDALLGILHAECRDESNEETEQLIITVATCGSTALINTAIEESCFNNFLESTSDSASHLSKYLCEHLVNITVDKSEEDNVEPVSVFPPRLLMEEDRKTLHNVFNRLFFGIDESKQQKQLTRNVKIVNIEAIFKKIIQGINYLPNNESLNDPEEEKENFTLVLYDKLVHQSKKFVMGNANCISSEYSKNSQEIPRYVEVQILKDFEGWIKYQANPENMSQLLDYFNEWAEVYEWQTHIGDAPPGVIEKFKSTTIAKINERHKTVEKSLQFYSDRMEKRLAQSVYLSEEVFQQEYNDAVHMLTKNGDKLDTLTNVGLDVIRKQFEIKNDAAYKLQKDMLKGNQLKIKDFFTNVIAGFLDSKLYIPELHQRMYRMLFKELENIKDIFRDDLVTSTITDIRNELYDSYVRVHLAKMPVIEQNFNMLKSATADSKKHYDKQMDAYLKQNKTGISKDVLHQFHLKNLEQSQKSLNCFITQNIGEHEHSERHMNALDAQIEKSYQSLQKDNNDALGKTSDNISDRHHTAETKSTDVFSKEVKLRPPRDLNSKSSTSENRKTLPPGEDREKIVHNSGPIFFQMSLKNIFSAKLRNEKVITSEPNLTDNDMVFCEEASEVILCKANGDYKWMCGTGIKQLQSASIINSWKLDRCLTAVYMWTEKVRVNDIAVEVTTPFLLSVIFKYALERLKIESASLAMISVPAWFSSFLRQQIMEAGKITGFENVQIFNENTVLAFRSFCNTDTKSPTYQIIVSENSDRVDISSYTCHDGVFSLELNKHFSDIDANNLDKRDYLNEVVPEPAAAQSRVQYLKSKILRSDSSKTSSGKITIGISILNEIWKNKLIEYGNSFENCKVVLISHNEVSLGLASIYQNGQIYPIKVLTLEEETLFDIYVYEGNLVKPCSTVTRKEIIAFSASPTEFVFDLKIHTAGDFQFVQRSSTRKNLLGTLSISDKLKSSYRDCTLTVRMVRESDGIIKLKNIIDISRNVNYSNKPIDENLYKWNSSSLKEEQIEFYKKLFNYPLINVKPCPAERTREEAPKVQPRRRDSHDRIAKKYGEVKTAIINNDILFKSVKVRECVLDDINGALSALKDPMIQDEVVEDLKEKLQKISVMNNPVNFHK